MDNNMSIGLDFESETQSFLIEQKINVLRHYEVSISINGMTFKKHKFDFGNETTLVECKCYNWTINDKVPSAKISTLNEAILYFIAAPDNFRKILFLPLSIKGNGVSLVEYYLDKFYHLIPNNIELVELDVINGLGNIYRDGKKQETVKYKE